MKNLDLSDEVLSALQLQKEYIGLQLEEKIIRLFWRQYQKSLSQI